MLQADATLPRLPEQQRESVRRDYRFSLLTWLLAIGLVGSVAGLLGRAWFAEREAAASTQRAIEALKHDGFSVHVWTVGSEGSPRVRAHGNGRVTVQSVQAMLRAPRIASYSIEQSAALSLPLDQLSKLFDVGYDDGQLYLSRSRHP